VAYGRNQFVWLMAACVALAAQVVPQSLCRSCDRPCCESAAANAGASAVVPDAPVSGGCPLCVAATDRCPIESVKQPCRCQLDARQDEPMASSRGSIPSADQVAQHSPPAAALAEPPPALGVSREYLAASLAVPIRPPRILFGVWRN
jgi:hypothetical protein